MIPPEALAAKQHLFEIDPDFALIEAAAGPLHWRTRPLGFPGLLQAIVAQLISNQAARAIWNRLAALPGATTPEGLLRLTETELRGVGLSGPKIQHARSLAAAFVEGRLDHAVIATLPDTAAVAAITAIRGLGPWTAEVYLLFAEQRFDVFPAGDVAVQSAYAALKKLPARPDAKALRGLAAPWSPYRAIAARLLWHHWRHMTGRMTFDD